MFHTHTHTHTHTPSYSSPYQGNIKTILRRCLLRLLCAVFPTDEYTSINCYTLSTCMQDWWDRLVAPRPIQTRQIVREPRSSYSFQRDLINNIPHPLPINILSLSVSRSLSISLCLCLSISLYLPLSLPLSLSLHAHPSQSLLGGLENIVYTILPPPPPSLSPPLSLSPHMESHIRFHNPVAWTIIFLNDNKSHNTGINSNEREWGCSGTLRHRPATETPYSFHRLCDIAGRAERVSRSRLGQPWIRSRWRPI
jgi:hypothetical protein